MKWIYRFFVVLGVIFFCMLLGLGYFIVADPLNLRPILMSMYTKEASTKEEPSVLDSAPGVSTKTEVNTGVMTAKQEEALKSVGISPDAVPAQFTPEQIDCFVGILGEERVNDIKAGDTPTPTEFFQAKECI
jgi:hypothetical protein